MPSFGKSIWYHHYYYMGENLTMESDKQIKLESSSEVTCFFFKDQRSSYIQHRLLNRQISDVIRQILDYHG